MIKKLALAFYVCLFLISLTACYKQDVSEQNNPIDKVVAKAWLNKHGLSYRNETMNVTLVSNETLTAKLNWEKASQYSWKGQDYIDIPFEFSGYGTTPRDENMAPASFNLVIRRKGADDFEGAVRTTLYSAISENVAGQREKRTIQIYRLINGEESNIWVSTLDNSSPIAAYRSSLNSTDFLNLKKAYAEKGISTAPRSVCGTSSTTIYDVNCWYASEEDEKNQYATCTFVPRTIYTTECSTLDDNPTPGYPPTGGGGTSEVDSEASSPKKVDCKSFVYVKTSTANWQEAGVTKIRLRWVYTEPTSRHGFLREIWVDKIVFGLPTYYTNANGTITHLSAGEAATKSAILLDQAKTDTYLRFKESNADEATVIMYFKKMVHEYMTTQMGTAGATGTGNPDIKFKEEDRSNWTDPYDC